MLSLLQAALLSTRGEKTMMNSMAFAAADAVVVDAFRYGNAWKNERWSICHPLPKYFNST